MVLNLKWGRRRLPDKEWKENNAIRDLRDSRNHALHTVKDERKFVKLQDYEDMVKKFRNASKILGKTD